MVARTGMVLWCGAVCALCLLAACSGREEVTRVDVSQQNKKLPARHVLLRGALVEVTASRTLFERAGDAEFFYTELRITSRGVKPVGVMLDDPHLVYPNQWGPSRTPHRTIISERRLVLPEVCDRHTAMVLDAWKAGKLTTIAPGATLTLYKKFNASGRADVDRQLGSEPYLIIPFDGLLRVTDGVRVEHLMFPAEDAMTSPRELVIPAPLRWSTIPASGPHEVR